MYQFISISDEIKTEVSRCDETPAEEISTDIINNEVPTDDTEISLPAPDINITKQLSEEKIVLNTAVED